jgi:predicted RNase H-like HicB family nuclease
MKTYVFKVELEEDDDGRWSAIVPTLPGCGAWGDSKEHALTNLHEALQAYLEVLFEDGRPLPEDAVVEVIPAPAVAVTL